MRSPDSLPVMACFDVSEPAFLTPPTIEGPAATGPPEPVG
jgi:hypothetical protein